LLGSIAADVCLKTLRKQSPARRPGCSLLAFASFPAAWQEPEIMGINIESDSKESRHCAAESLQIESVWVLPGLAIQDFGLDLTLSLGFVVEPAAERL